MRINIGVDLATQTLCFSFYNFPNIWKVTSLTSNIWNCIQVSYNSPFNNPELLNYFRTSDPVIKKIKGFDTIFNRL